MALKGDRQYVFGGIDHFVFGNLERGGIVSYNGTASGVAMDSAVNTVGYAAAPSGVRPAGILMQDVDGVTNLTKQHINYYKDVVPTGGKAFVLKQGEVTTNMIYPGHNPVPGSPAYVIHSGLIGITDSVADGQSASRKVGQFVTGKDESGFAKLIINLP